MQTILIVSDLPIVEQTQILLDADYYFVCSELRESGKATNMNLSSEFGKLYTNLYIQQDKIFRTFNNDFKFSIKLEDMDRVKLPKKGNPKVKPIKLYKKEETIIAMKKLVLEYLNGTHCFDSITCSLCKLHKAKDKSPNVSSCKTCPWICITGHMCKPTPSSENLIRATELIEWIDIYQKHKESKFEPFSVTLKINNLEQAAFWLSTFGNSNDYKSPGSGAMYDEIKSKTEECGFKYQDIYMDTQNPFWSNNETYSFPKFQERLKKEKGFE